MNLKNTSRFVVAVTFALTLSLLCGFWVYAAKSNDWVSLSASTKEPPYSTEAADKRGIEIMELSGTWGQTMEEVLPYFLRLHGRSYAP